MYFGFIINTGFSSDGIVEVVLPSWHGIDFLGLELADGYTLEINENLNRPVYVAIGDSISHGTGQGSVSYKTWPFLLAR